METERDKNLEISDELKYNLERIETLESSLRSFTSCRGMNFDETFEGILRNEFTKMRQNYEKQVSSLKELISIQKRQALIDKAEKEKKVDELETAKVTLSNRLF